MSRTQPRSADGRFANGLWQAADVALRSGAECHRRLFFTAPEDIEGMAGTDESAGGDKWLYAVAIEAIIRWTDDGRPTRHIKVEYVTPSRDRFITREIDARFARFGGDSYSFEGVDLSAVSRRISAPSADTHRPDKTPGSIDLCDEALRAHEEVA